MTYLLFSECLQNDFVGPIAPGDRLPNALHVGRKESRRLLGDPGGPWQVEGPLARFLAGWAAGAGPDHHALHLRDWHDPTDPGTRAHLEHFGPHCLQHSPGAEFVTPLAALTVEAPRHHVVASAILSDFVGTSLAATLDGIVPGPTPVRAGIIGVWTDVKVRYLAYDLITRRGYTDIAVCSALTASSSHSHHQEALAHLASGLGVTVIDSLPAFLGWLGLESGASVPTLRGRPVPTVTQPDGAPLGDEVRRLVEYLFRDCAEVSLKPLSGGFSGSQVFMTTSVDRRGLSEVPFVVKVDSHAKIARERAAVESIENVLGAVSPRLSDYVDLETLGGIKYQFATMHGGAVRTLKKAIQAAADAAAVGHLIETISQRILSRLYQKTRLDRLQLYRYYDFQPRYADKTLAIARDLGGTVTDGRLLIPGIAEALPDPAGFYRGLPERLAQEPSEVPCGWIHGDLNLANVLLDDGGNAWMIDYFWTRDGHALQDIAKLENDLKFIMVPLADDAALSGAVAWERRLLAHADLTLPLPPLPEALQGDEALAKSHAAISGLRRLAGRLLCDAGIPAPGEIWQYRLAQLRYSAHTLTFDECDDRQRRFALASTCLLADSLQASG